MINNFIAFLNSVLDFKIMNIDLFTYLITITIFKLIIDTVKAISGGRH